MRPYAVIMPVHIVRMVCSLFVPGMAVMVRNAPTNILLLLEKPASYVGNFPGCVIEAYGKNCGRIHDAVDRFDDRRPRRDAVKLVPDSGQFVGRGDVGLGQKDARH